MSRLTDAINQAKAQGRVAMIPYLPAGFPSADGFFKALDELDAVGADIIERGQSKFVDRGRYLALADAVATADFRIIC